MSSQPKAFLTPEQYLQIEAKAESKSEYYRGEMFLMAEGSADHNQIAANLNRVFGNEFLERRCFVYGSDMRVSIPTGLLTYPDAVLVCGERHWQNASRSTLLNPTVIFEVLSDSTEAYDRGEKFWHYRHIPSLLEYILISQTAFRVDQFMRQADGEFKLHSCDAIDAVLEVAAVGCSISLRDIYFKTELIELAA